LANICCNLHITAHSSLSCPSISIRRNLCIATHSSLNYSPAGIWCNLRIVVWTSLSCPLISICHTLLLKSNNMPLPSKTLLADTQVLQRGLLFLFVHWFNEGCCVEGWG
jgi:hypothetical protein